MGHGAGRGPQLSVLGGVVPGRCAEREAPEILFRRHGVGGAGVFLQAARVDYGQGWFWSTALSATELQKVLDAGLPNWRRDLVDRLNAAR